MSKWINTNDSEPTSERNKYWVWFPCGSVIMCNFNNYNRLGGPVNYWQDMNCDDLPMHETKYIEIVQPQPPKH